MDALSIMRAVAALAIVLGLIGALYWGARRFSNLRPSSPLSEDLKVVAWKPFDGRKRLAVVRWGDEEHLILTSQAQDLHIASRKAPEDDTPESSDEA
tara:strand:- start:13790 stop:14080 length:291 start_codon:yes stop_codon:yes gene_type:complete